MLLDPHYILFLCSGNYYRSRYAEWYFNELINNTSLSYSAFSRGLAVPWSNNPGPISMHTLSRIEFYGKELEEPVRYPLQATLDDFDNASLTIAIKETEHRHMMETLFPELANSITYWEIHDIDVARPEETLPNIEEHVSKLISRLEG